ncbi:MAG: single-stranded-DNA-specific exonuclease RecJ [Bacteroidetes bacterium]|nr:MAG: single-stranded-DNA-specific exonuclease RecJ [Bacteroidota bacterium]PTM13026.1 MAG: single-stranded-DNA-specific exonuclease RecJ [Bacteroidota bacterium]
MQSSRWLPPVFAEEHAVNLQQALGLHPVLCQLLAQREIDTPEKAKAFFEPQWDLLHDPFLMQDMEKAVVRLALALKRGEKILIYGDYDVDGTMSVSFLYQFLLNQGHRAIDFHIPDRYKEGYGLSAEGVSYAARQGVTLLITVDCGIRAQEQVDNARRQGMDVIICDHHLPGDDWPFATAVLDPKRPDCNYPDKNLSGCGVAFKLAQGLLQHWGRASEELQSLTDFVAISIACDVMPVMGENRVLASFGLQQMNNTRKYGLRALIKVSNRKTPLRISDIVFGIGPIINASGRMADAGLVVKLMLASSRQVAKEHAEQLRLRNELRREYDKRTADEAREEAAEIPLWKERKSFVLYQPHWHKGVIGIVAARLSADFHRPTIVLTKSDDVLVGSARSAGNVDLFSAITSCEDLLLSFGGHTHAAGLSLREENWAAFATRFEAAIDTLMPENGLQPQLPIAAELKLAEVTPEFYQILRQFAPFGPANRNPVFVSTQVAAFGPIDLLKAEHIRLMVQQDGGAPLHAIAFGLGKYFDQFAQHEEFTICYSIEENHWGGTTNLQLMIKDIDFTGEKWAV